MIKFSAYELSRNALNPYIQISVKQKKLIRT